MTTPIHFFSVRDTEEVFLRRQITERALPIDPHFFREPLSADTAPRAADAAIISVFVDSTVTREILAALPSLQCIATRSTGYDHIDTTAAAERKITVTTVPSYGENTVAEHAFGLLLALSKKIFQGFDRIRESGNFSNEGLEGFDLKGKTLGVVGTGRIGRHAIAIGKGFGMRVVAYDTRPDETLSRELGFDYLPLDELLAQSDVVTLHVPYLPATHHLIDAAAVGKMKRGAVIINTSRGAVIETAALLTALTNGHLGGAGLDVLEEEGVTRDEMGFILRGTSEGHDIRTILANHVLIDLPNVILTPHNAFNTKEAIERILTTTVDNIAAFLGGTPQNVVSS